MFQSLLKIPQNLGGLLRSKQFPLVTPSYFKGSSTNQHIIDGITGDDEAEQNGNTDQTVTQIYFGSTVKGYSTKESDTDVVNFVRMNPKIVMSEFILNQKRKMSLYGSEVHSPELNGLRGIITGKYPHLALYQYQLPDSPLKELVMELSCEYWDRIYNHVRKPFISRGAKGKNALQQLYQLQVAHYILKNHSCPKFHFKMPECFEITGRQHCKKLFDAFMESRETEVPQEYIDLLFKEIPEQIDDRVHKDEIFSEKIFNYILERNEKNCCT
ncbi:uncharacterized protein LOC116343341 [Contarinia nasturtii]|uniref:uncharacterized protein LOC116343341 n=1 Tax=Contarinia nasturtii TaxID=265458 RepID=UPI0012D417A6|nr:uncharacterized protein LOC116343341 [Contarinia nasturtii]